MPEFKLNKEIFAALENCKDAKEVMALAKSKGIDLNEEQANKVFASTHGDKLTDEEMDMIVGGGENECPENEGRSIMLSGWCQHYRSDLENKQATCPGDAEAWS